MNRLKSTIKCLVATAFTAIMATSCASSTKTFYQVYEVSSEEVPEVNGNYVFNNDDLMVKYNFCAQGGTVTFICHNKTDKTVYILLDNSFYINNGIAYDYYIDSEFTTTYGESVGASQSASASATAAAGATLAANVILNSVNGSYSGTAAVGASGSVTRSNGIGMYSATSKSESYTTRAPRIEGIPPHTAKIIKGFSINNSPIMLCGKSMTMVNYPKRVSTTISYGKDNSPIVFSNHISYSFNHDGSDMKNFLNTFYISGIRNFTENAVFSKTANNEDDSNPNSRLVDPCADTSEVHFLITDPKTFYNVYQKREY